VLTTVIGVSDKPSRTGGLLSALTVWLLAITVTYDVILRMLGTPTLWASEVSIYLMLAMAFLGAGATQAADGHFRVNFVRDLCPRKVQIVFDMFAVVISLLFALGFTYGAWKLVAFSRMLDMKTSTILQVPMCLLQGFLLIGGILLSLAALRDLLRVLSEGSTARDATNSGEVI